jgi:hypothetical protein
MAVGIQAGIAAVLLAAIGIKLPGLRAPHEAPRQEQTV